MSIIAQRCINAQRDDMTNPLQKIWSYLQRANDYWDD